MKDPLKNLSAHVASRLEEEDYKGAVRIASSDESFASINEVTINLLKQKHPPPHPLSAKPPQPHSCNSIEISTYVVVRSIQCFQLGQLGQWGALMTLGHDI